jgi:uncharacterized protein YegP (UPF0339 family)
VTPEAANENSRKEVSFMYFEIVSASGGYRAHIRGGNNELMFWTEVYTTKASARHAIDVVKAYAKDAPIYDRTQ